MRTAAAIINWTNGNCTRNWWLEKTLGVVRVSLEEVERLAQPPWSTVSIVRRQLRPSLRRLRIDLIWPLQFAFKAIAFLITHLDHHHHPENIPMNTSHLFETRMNFVNVLILFASWIWLFSYVDIMRINFKRHMK